jgi:hypothetical protein
MPRSPQQELNFASHEYLAHPHDKDCSTERAILHVTGLFSDKNSTTYPMTAVHRINDHLSLFCPP